MECNPLKDKSRIWWNLLYQVIDKSSKHDTLYLWYNILFGHKQFFFASNIMDYLITQLYCINHTIKLFYTSHVWFQQYNKLSLKDIVQQKFIYNSNIMMGYYNQCAFYCVTINCIKPKKILIKHLIVSTWLWYNLFFLETN